jgi:hypothetical protein
VKVHEARNHDQPVQVDFSPGPAVNRSDFDNLTAGHTDVGVSGGSSGPVDERTVTEDQIKH